MENIQGLATPKRNWMISRYVLGVEVAVKLVAYLNTMIVANYSAAKLAM